MLKPKEFYELSPLELLKLAEGFEKRRLNDLWIKAYFTANLMATQIKDITPEKLMKPFLPKKSAEEKSEERNRFFKEFYEKRKEAETCQP